MRKSYLIISVATSIVLPLLFSNMRLNNISDGLNPLSSFANLSLSTPHRVLIVGCAYGGISAVVNLLDYSHGKARTPVYPGPDFKGLKSKKGIEITVIDERDGYCTSCAPLQKFPILMRKPQSTRSAHPWPTLPPSTPT